MDELLAGEPGTATLELVMRAGARAVRGFPPREGHGQWSDDAIADEMGDLFARKPHLLTTAVAAGVESDDALEAYLVTVIGNAMKDQAKSTDVGKLRRRFENVLGSDDRFVRVTGAGEAWVLTELVGSVWPGDLAPLRSAAAAVRGVYIEKLNPAGPTPAEVAEALRTVAAAVFERFFPSGAAPVSLDAPGGVHIADPRPGPDAAFLVADAARAVFAGLTEQERALMPHLGKTPAERLGVLEDAGPTETEAVAAAVIEKVRLAAVDQRAADEVVLALRDLCVEEP